MRRRPFELFAAAVCTLALAAALPHARGLHAQAPAGDASRVDTSFFSGLKWRNIGPNRGGRSIAVAGSAARPLGTTSGRPAVASGRRPTAARPGGRSADEALRSSSVGAVAVAGVPARRRLRRHGGGRAARQRHPGRRHLQVHRRRQDLDARRGSPTRRPSAGSASTRRTPTSSTWRPWATPTGRTRSAASSGRPTAERRGSGAVPEPKRPAPSTSASTRTIPQHALRGALGGVPHAALAVERRPGSGLFKSTDGGDTWTELTRNPGLPQGCSARSAWRVRRRLEPRVRDRRGGGRRHLPVGRRRRHLEQGQRRAPVQAARLLLHAHLRRPEGQGRGLRPEHGVLPVGRRGQDLEGHPGAARRQPRPVDRAERPAPDGQRQRRRGERVVQRRARPGRARISRRRSSITWPPPPTCPITSAARSRTTALPACRWTATGYGVLRRRAAGRAATSRPTRGTPTSSTPAATAAC